MSISLLNFLVLVSSIDVKMGLPMYGGMGNSPSFFYMSHICSIFQAQISARKRLHKPGKTCNVRRNA